MRTNRKKSIYIALIIILMIISIGYALIFTDLKMDGILGINSNKWDVYWDSIQVTAGSKTPTTAATINANDNTKVSFNVYLENPGDFYEFTLDAVNNGTMDAVVEDVDLRVNDNPISTLPNYIRYTVTYADGTPIVKNDSLAKKSGSTPTTKKYKVRVEFRSDINGSDLENSQPLNLHFVYDVTYIQAGTMPKSPWVLPEGKTAATLSVGDEICVREQCFNFVKYDGTDIVMLAKWNLKVGLDIHYSLDPSHKLFTSTDSGYGLQGEYIVGNLYYGNPDIDSGMVPFSYLNYWNTNSTDIYDPINYAGEPEYDEYLTVTNPNYSVAYYVEQYKARLVNDYHVSIKEARLLTYDEAVDPSIGCSAQGSCPTTGDSAFITNTAFWLGTSRYSSSVWWINDRGLSSPNYSPDYDSYSEDHWFGVRPVIVITQSSL